MKRMKSSLSVLIIAVFALVGNAQAKGLPEASEDVRKAAALEILKKTPNVVLVYAKGLCCQSCAIGIRKKIRTLDFVDTSRFNSGVALDARTQLVTVAVVKGKTVDANALSGAINSAGYDPINLYTFEKGTLIVTSIAQKK